MLELLNYSYQEKIEQSLETSVGIKVNELKSFVSSKIGLEDSDREKNKRL